MLPLRRRHRDLRRVETRSADSSRNRSRDIENVARFYDENRARNYVGAHPGPGFACVTSSLLCTGWLKTDGAGGGGGNATEGGEKEW